MTASIAPIARGTLACLMIALVASACPVRQAVASPQAAQAAKYLDELLEWAVKAGKNLPNPAVGDELVDLLKAMATKGDELSPMVVELIKRNLKNIPVGVLDEELLKVMSANPELAESALQLAMKAAVRKPGARIAMMIKDLGPGAPTTLAKLVASLTDEEATILMKAWNRLLSGSDWTKLAAALERADLPPRVKGEIFESLTRFQLSKGALRSKSGLKQGGKVIAGQYNGVHGIDGIGAAEDGSPVIYEISMFKDKALTADANGLVQLSPTWVADRWNKLIENATPQQLDELKAIGIDPKWLRKVTPEEADRWIRKLVAAHQSALTDANRFAAQLGPDDLLLLGST